VKQEIFHGTCKGAPSTSFAKDIGRNRGGAMRLRSWAVLRYGSVSKAANRMRVHVNVLRFVPARFKRVRGVEIIRKDGDRLLDMLEIEAQQ
jgi:hypothetical protein